MTDHHRPPLYRRPWRDDEGPFACEDFYVPALPVRTNGIPVSVSCLRDGGHLGPHEGEHVRFDGPNRVGLLGFSWRDGDHGPGPIRDPELAVCEVCLHPGRHESCERDGRLIDPPPAQTMPPCDAVDAA